MNEDELTVRRVSNGFVISAGQEHGRIINNDSVKVARSPEDLSKIVEDWAHTVTS